jgi:hypothetical protein
MAVALARHAVSQKGGVSMRNGLFDCEDDSAGPGTAGTANYWINNLGDTANRMGLCKATPK